MSQSINLIKTQADQLFESKWAHIHERERRAMRGERPVYTERIVVPLSHSAAMQEARETLTELASAGDSPATRLALAHVQRAIDTLAVAVARDMLGS